ncbi:prolactin-like [Genypterus blacodes]|uniref:prolactin-like n=1 Tax=Genypterus blacodes TaxID=154954 RepID=UPI003F77121B
MGLSCLLLRGRWVRVGAAPICSDMQESCQVASLTDLFERVLQHSARLHSVSSDLHSDFEQYFLPSKNQIHRISHNCRTSAILAPDGKENAQRMPREELMGVILKLLVAWKDPLWYFHQSMAHHHDFNNYSSSKALEMTNMVHKLHTGVETVAEKMQVLGMISNFVNRLASPEALLPSDHTTWGLLENYDVLYCFRRDSNRVQNYLKILKCAFIPEEEC